MPYCRTMTQIHSHNILGPLRQETRREAPSLSLKLNFNHLPNKTKLQEFDKEEVIGVVLTY